MLTLGTRVQTQVSVNQLNLGTTVLDIPLLLRRIIEGLTKCMRYTIMLNQYSVIVRTGRETYTTVGLPAVLDLGTTTNLVFTIEVMYTLR